MIIDAQTNFLYLADTLPVKYPDFYLRLEKLLKVINIDFALLPDTKDVWAVDYMPIQIDSNKFVQFVYKPSYLKSKKDLNTISDVFIICNQINIDTIKSNIILDGGNVIRSSNKVIMTDRVFYDNPTIHRKELIKQLYDLLEIDKLFFVPEQPGDFTGHSDGMIRFIDENTVVINDFSREKDWFYRAFEIAIHNTGLDYIKIPYNVYENKKNYQANGTYINYLQMENKIIIPLFGKETDDLAVRKLESIFSEKHVSTIESNDVANDGGVLNCISWNILIDK